MMRAEVAGGEDESGSMREGGGGSVPLGYKKCGGCGILWWPGCVLVVSRL